MPDNLSHADALAKDYSQYVAIAPIDLDGARAFNPGHAVPASHVERGVVDKSLVAKVSSKAADAVPTTANPVQKG